MELEESAQESSECTEHNTETELSGDSGYCADSQGESQSQTQSQTNHWGRLYPLKSRLQVIDLIANKVTVGKVGSDIILDKELIPPEIFVKCSKLHFELQRQQISVMGAPTTRVVVFDKSSNGTFINGHILKRRSGVQKMKVLNSNDVIGLPAGRSSPAYEVYVYIDSLQAVTHPNSTIPHSVRKKYQVSLRLGIGAFGEVSLVFDKLNGRPFAMKTIVKDLYANSHMLNSCKKKLLNEIDILQTVNHPNVIKLEDVIDCKKEHFLFLEYMEGKDLFHRIVQSEKLDEALTKLYFYQISKGVNYLHSIGIIHRDLKPANILLASCNKNTLVKLTDFGLSKILSSATMMKTLCGTKMYVAPEVIFGGGSYEYTEQVDIWSLGVILYVCLSGAEPFASEPDEVEKLIKETVFTMPSTLWNSISDDVKNLIRRMLTKDPNERIRIDEILEDSWIQDDGEMLSKVNALYGSSSDDLHSETLTDSEFHPTSSPPHKRFRSN